MTQEEMLPRYERLMQKEQEPIYQKTVDSMGNVCTCWIDEITHKVACSYYDNGECNDLLDGCPYKAKPRKIKYDGGQKICLNCRKATEAYVHSMHGICDHSYRNIDARFKPDYKCNRPTGEKCPSYQSNYNYANPCLRCDYFIKLGCWEPNGRVRNAHCGKPKEIPCLLELPDTPCTECKYYDENLKCPSCGGPGDIRAWVDGVAIVHCHKCDDEWRDIPRQRSMDEIAEDGM